MKTLGNTDILEATATPDEDYKSVDTLLEFKKGEGVLTVEVEIKEDNEWEPDEDFYVECYDLATGQRLPGEDTRTRVTILDDDKPGMLVFAEKKAQRHPVNEKECWVTVDRVQGTDG